MKKYILVFITIIFVFLLAVGIAIAKKTGSQSDATETESSAAEETFEEITESSAESIAETTEAATEEATEAATGEATEEPTEDATTEETTTEATTEATSSAEAEATTGAEESNDPDGKITLRFAGDFTLAEEGGYGVYMAIIDALDSRFGGDITKSFSSDLLSLMRSADIFMLNNEFTYSKRGTPVSGKNWTFRANPSRVSALAKLGVDIVGTANNHAYDWGEASLLDTLTTLDEAGIPHVGTGKNLDEACQAVYLEVEGKTIAFVGMTFDETSTSSEYLMTKPATAGSPGVLHAGVNPEEALAAIGTAKANSDYCVAFVHWGTQGSYELNSDQKVYSRKIIDAGADAIIGTHPHVVQGFEFYKGKPIMYSTGNYWFNSKTRQSCLVELSIDVETMDVQVKYLPCLQKNCRTTLITDPESYAESLQDIRNKSIGVYIDEGGIVTEAPPVADEAR